MAHDEPDIADTPPDEHRPRRRWLRRIAIGLGGLLALVIVVLGIGFIAINSDSGRRFAARQIEGLEFDTGMRINVREIRGSLFGGMSLIGFTVSDTKGVFLRSPEVKIDWQPTAYLKNHIDVRSLTAETVVLLRLPEFKPSTEEGPLLPDIDIDIGRMRIDRFIAEPPVASERRIARLSGLAHIADQRAQVTLNGTTIAVQGGGAGGDRLAVKLDAMPERNRFDIDVKIDAPAGGVLAAMAGVKDPMALTIAGRGDWAKWDGRLAADLAGSELARLEIKGRNGTFGIRGPTRVARLLTGPSAALLGPVTNLNLAATLDKRRIDLAGVVFSDAFNMSGDGAVDLADNTFDGLKLAFVLARPSVLAPNLVGRNVRGVLTLDGAFATPRVDYELTAARLAMNEMGIENLRAAGAARVDADKIVIPVAARATRITGLDVAAGGALRNIRLDGDLAVDWPRILSDNMRIRSDRIDARTILLADASRGLYTGAIDGRINGYRVESVGLFDLDTDADLKSVRGGFALAGRVRARSTRLFNDGVRDFLGGNLVASSDIAYGPDGIIRFGNVRMAAPAIRVTGGRGSYAPNGRIELAATGVSNQYGRVGVQLAGTVSNPLATVTAERPNLGIGLANLRARVTGTRAGYRLNATGRTDYGDLTADVTLGTGRGPMSLTINRANLGGIDFAGRLQQTRAGPFAGRLDATGQGLAGVVRLGAVGRYQEAVVNLRANSTVLPGPANLAIGGAIVDARVILYDRPHVVADAQLAQTRIGSLNLNAARVIVDYRNGRGQAKLFAEGVSGVPFRVAGNAELEPNLWRASLQGRLRGLAFRTTSPARIVPGRRGYELLPTRIDFGQGNLRLAGTYGPGLKIQSRLDSVDMAIVNAFMPGYGIGGRATGSLDFAQPSPGAFPRADARLTISNFTRTTAVSVSQPLDVNFAGKLLPDGGTASAVMRRRGTVVGRVQASLRPLGPGSGSWTARLLGAPLSGGIRYNGPADTLLSLAGTPQQRLSGPIGLAADFSGRVADPQLAGIVRANNLTYENLTYGTKLTNLALAGRFAGDRLQVERLTATAGSGTVSAQGYVSLSAQGGYPMDLRATLNNARLARSEDLAASATGNLALTKFAGQTALLAGTLRLPETRYRIVRQGSAEVPALTGVRFKPPRGRLRITGDETAETSPATFDLMRLDIDLVAPNELFVSGMGLESEWRADLKVTGTRAAPRWAGNLELIRGTLGFADRSFEVTDGRIQFTGGSAADPVIALRATDDIEDVTVNVQIAGQASNPQITFSSTPGLPQDEILARILFGSSIGNIDAIQAVQLAASLNSLRGSGGGLNPLGKLRSATGIDRLRILSPDEASGRGTALAAGQYLSDDIYVEIITDARGFTATQLEVSLSKALSLLSQAGGSGLTNVSLRYRKNY